MIPRLRSLAAAVAILSGATLQAAAPSPFAGHAFGRVSLSSSGLPSLRGLVEQSITGFTGSRGKIVSTSIVTSTPLALGFTDQLSISGKKITLTTDLDLTGARTKPFHARGRAKVKARVITYSAATPNGSLRVKGTIRRTGSGIIRTEKRTQEGGTITVRMQLFR